jgi:hypothetical protein
MLRALLTAPLLLAPLPALAQRTDEQLWLAANASAPIGDGARVTLESIGRFSDRAGGFFHSEFGALGSVTVTKGVEIAAGYRHVEDWDHGRALPNEERLRQIVTITLSKRFATRLRLEQRFNSSGSGVGVRFRPQQRFTLPLGDKGPTLFVTHEDFINLNDTRWGQRSGYERMRNAIGITVPLAKNLSTDIGYLNQYRFGRGRARDQMDHAMTLTLSLTLDGVFSGHHGDAD